MNQERFARIQRMLAMRQPDLTVCLEQVNKSHNVAAISVPVMRWASTMYTPSGRVACA